MSRQSRRKRALRQDPALPKAGSGQRKSVERNATSSRSAGDQSPSRVSSKEFSAWAIGLLVLYSVLGTWGQFDFSNLMGYYSMQADALLAGRLFIDARPDEVNLIDMVPFEGRYYLQWGPVPAVFHLLVKLMGFELTDRVACLLAGWLTSLAFFHIVLALKGRYFRDLPLWVCRLFFAAFALGTPTAFVALRGTIYHESIAIAAMFVVFGLVLFLRHTKKPSARMTLLCGVALALAVGTRVTAICYGAGFFLGLAALERLWKPGLRSSLLRLAGFACPVLAVCLMHLAYNQARFGSPFEYGLRYMPDPLQRQDGFEVRKIPANFVHYVIAPVGVKAELPWITHSGWPPRFGSSTNLPPSWVTNRTEGMSSMLVASPFLLFAFGLFRFLDRSKSYPGEFVIFVATVVGSSGLSFLLMLSFTAASRRYMHDFVPLMMVAAAVGAGLFRQGKPDWKRWRWPLAAALVFSTLIHIHLAFTQPFFTPPSDPSAMKAFVTLSPLARGLFDWPELNKDEAVVRNDLGVRFLNQRRYAAALEHFEIANKLMPGAPVIEKNLQIASTLLHRSSKQ